jgi:hypothetical protein
MSGTFKNIRGVITASLVKMYSGSFCSQMRLMLVRAGDGLGSTAEIIELSRDLGKPRYDLWEIPIWEESVDVVGKEVF